MNRTEIVTEISQFVAQQANISDAAMIGENVDLFEQGILDSLMAALLLTFCQQRFKCDLMGQDLSEDQMRTVGGLASVIASQENQ